VYGRDPHRIATQLHASTDLLTVTSFRIPPGGHTDPPDKHTGDELYWVLQGSVRGGNPETGQTEAAGEGEGIWIPEGTWHQAFNAGEERLEVLSFCAPTIWSKAAGGTHIHYDKEPAYFAPSSSAALSGAGTGRFPGGWPAGWRDDRKQRRLVCLSRDRALAVIWGRDQFCQASVFLSCDRQHVVCLTIPPGGRSDPEKHAGDEVICCLSGGLSAVTGAGVTDQRSVSAQRLPAAEGGLLLIPSGVDHCYYNFGDKPATCVMGVAPRITEAE